MTVPITLSNLANLQNETTAVNTINSNNSAISTAFFNALYTSGDQMEGNLDMNSNQILNLPSPGSPQSPVRLIDIVNPVVPTPSILAGNNVYTGNNAFSGANTFSGVTNFTNNVYFKGQRPWVDVIAYGADPTGVVDSTTPIQNAVNAANGGIVYFPAGQYKISSQITVSVISTQLIGAGRLSTIIRTTSPSANMFNIAASDVRVAHMCLSGTQGQVSTGGSAILASGNWGGGCLENLYITDVFDGIVLTGGPSGWKICFVQLVNIYGNFGFVSSNGGGHFLSDNQFDPLFYSTTMYGTTSGYGNWATNTVYAAGAVVVSNSGVFICQTGGTSSSTGIGPVISPFNTLIGDGSVQWYFITMSGSSGIALQNVSNSNFIYHMDISGPWQSAISINNCDGNIIEGVTIGQTIGTGIQLQTGATNTNITGCVFDGMSFTFGIGVADNNGSAAGTRVTNNQFNGSGWNAIIIQGSSNWIVTGNTITGAGNITPAPAISVGAGTQKFVISNNVFTATSGQTGSIQVLAGGSDFYNIVNNIVAGVAVVDGGTGTHKTLSGNN